MKKQITIVTTVIILIFSIILVFALKNGSTVKDVNSITNIKNDSNLDILVNLGAYSFNAFDDSKLLDVSMQLAIKNGFLNEFSDENTYVQYVTKNDLHNVIAELTGHTLEAPIEITDFYYLYDSENEYYYYRPSTPSYFSVEEILSVKKNKDDYTIKCKISKTEDLEVIDNKVANVSLTYIPDNSLIKYKVNSIEFEQ